MSGGVMAAHEALILGARVRFPNRQPSVDRTGCDVKNGRLAEWLNAAVLKTAECLAVLRGSESYTFRHAGLAQRRLRLIRNEKTPWVRVPHPAPCASSSIGRAPAFQAGCWGFNSPLALQRMCSSVGRAVGL